MGNHILVVAVVAPQHVENGGEPTGVTVEVRQLFVAGADFVRDPLDVPVVVEGQEPLSRVERRYQALWPILRI